MIFKTMNMKIPNIPWIWSCRHCSKKHNWNYWYAEPLGNAFACGCSCEKTTIVHLVKGVWESLKAPYQKEIPPGLFVPVTLIRSRNGIKKQN